MVDEIQYRNVLSMILVLLVVGVASVLTMDTLYGHTRNSNRMDENSLDYIQDTSVAGGCSECAVGQANRCQDSSNPNNNWECRCVAAGSVPGCGVWRCDIANSSMCGGGSNEPSNPSNPTQSSSSSSRPNLPTRCSGAAPTHQLCQNQAPGYRPDRAGCECGFTNRTQGLCGCFALPDNPDAPGQTLPPQTTDPRPDNSPRVCGRNGLKDNSGGICSGVRVGGRTAANCECNNSCYCVGTKTGDVGARCVGDSSCKPGLKCNGGICRRVDSNPGSAAQGGQGAAQPNNQNKCGAYICEEGYLCSNPSKGACKKEGATSPNVDVTEYFARSTEDKNKNSTSDWNTRFREDPGDGGNTTRPSSQSTSTSVEECNIGGNSSYVFDCQLIEEIGSFSYLNEDGFCETLPPELLIGVGMTSWDEYWGIIEVEVCTPEIVVADNGDFCSYEPVISGSGTEEGQISFGATGDSISINYDQLDEFSGRGDSQTWQTYIEQAYVPFNFPGQNDVHQDIANFIMSHRISC